MVRVPPLRVDHRDDADSWLERKLRDLFLAVLIGCFVVLLVMVVLMLVIFVLAMVLVIAMVMSVVHGISLLG